MIKRILLLALLILPISGTCGAADGVECQLSIYEHDTTSHSDVLLWSDTTDFVKGMPASGFFGPFSAEIEIVSADSARTNFTVQLVTLGPVANTYSKTFAVEYGLPATIRDIAGKQNSRYTFTVIPNARKSIDTSICPYNHRKEGSFTFTPAAYMDIYYVQGSLGDFHFDSVRDLLDGQYRQLMAMANLTIPGKTLVYLCPCPLYSVIWDKRFGMSVDPTRNSAFAVFNRDVNTADPFIVQQTQILRNFGYSAPFLSEGFAGYYSFSVYDMRQIFKEKKQIPLRKLMATHDYYTANAGIADRTVASFVKFLIDQYKIDRFLKLYAAADDLNLQSAIESTYGKSLQQLEAEWKTFVDTSTISSAEFALHSGMAEEMLNYKQMLEYAEGMLRSAKTSTDSIGAYGQLKRAYFFNGDYYKATNIERVLLKVDSTNVLDWMALGSYQMMNGYYDSAFASFNKAKKIDSTNQLVNFNIALYYLLRNDSAKARQILVNNLSIAKGAQAQGESRVTLANLLMTSKDKSEHAKAAKMYQETISNFSKSLQINGADASLYMWIGISYLGLGDLDNALSFLHTAEFLETRPFYQGMIDLWLGKAYLASNKKDSADTYLAQVMSVSSAAYHQREAKALLQKD
jgi:tetratricopeptide (TPR) repeat protein